MNLIKTNSKMTEHEYRSLRGRVNSSAVKVFIEDRNAFVREFIMGEMVVRKDTASTIMGSLIHCLILEKEKFDEKFAITPSVISGQMGDLVENLYRRTVMSMNEEGHVTSSIQILLEQAINDTKFNTKGEEIAFKGKPFEKIVSMFEGSDAETLYLYRRKNHGKTVVSTYQIEKSELIVNEMKSNPWVTDYVNAVTTDGEQDVYSEYAIMFQYKDLPMKALLDRFIVNHKKRCITPVDIKTTWDADGVAYTYIKNLWYIQSAVYDMALGHFRTEHGLDNYTIEPLRFLIADTTGYMRSVSYKVTDYDRTKAYNGFMLKSGKKCIGLYEALNDIIYAQESGVWTATRTAIANSGEVLFEIQYA